LTRGLTVVRELPAAVVISLAIHAIAIASLRDVRRATAVEPDTTPAPAAAPVPAVVEWIDIELVPPPALAHAPVPPPPPDDGPRPAPRGPAAAAIRGSTGTAPATEASRGGPDPAPPASPWMKMREPDPPEGPSADFFDEFLARSKPLAPRDDLPDERTAAEVADAEAAVRRARPGPELDAARAALAGARAARAAEELRPDGGGTFAADKETYTMKVAADGTVDFDDKRNLQVHGLSGSFDVTDWAMRASGQDPYASHKLALLDRTRDQRVALGKRHRTQQLARSAVIAQGNVDRLWVKVTDPAERKRALFELWDECVETGTPEEIEGGRAARRVILGFIHDRMTGADAYTADELAAFNRKRKSQDRFEP
jgi:hypothetical protein